MTNLLQNGNFEADWSDGGTHRCLEITAGSVTELVRGNIFSPPHWLTWFRHEYEWAQPEVNDAHITLDPIRIYEGRRAIHLFTFSRAHDAGFLQQIEIGEDLVTVFLRSKARWAFKHNDVYWDACSLMVDAGALIFRAYAHAWSNQALEGHEQIVDKARYSCGVNDEYFFSSTIDAPTPTGDPWNDAVGNVTFQIGLDLRNGRDPFSPHVQWSNPAHIYNGFRLLAVSVPIPPRGLPREQYERTYVLMPPNADAKLVQRVAAATWGEKRYTIGGSADDAGIGDLDYRRVVAVNPDEWEDDLEAFYAEHYPGVEYVPVSEDEL